MNNEQFEHWQELESEVGSAVGLDLQIDTESQLAKDWIEDFNLKWLLIYHCQEYGIKGLLNDYPELKTS